MLDLAQHLATVVDRLSPFILSGLVIALFLGHYLHHNKGWLLLSIGWALNGLYLAFESIRPSPADAPLGLAFTVAQLQNAAFLLAADALSKRTRWLLAGGALLFIPWFLIANPRPNDLVLAGPGAGPSLLPLQVAVAASFAALANFQSGRTVQLTLGVFSRRSTRLVVWPWFGYAGAQILYLLRWLPPSDNVKSGIAVAFLLAMAMKVSILIGVILLLKEQLTSATKVAATEQMVSYNQIAFGWFAHELKNPIAAIGKSATAIDNYLNDRRLGSAQNQARKLVSLTNLVARVVDSAKLASEPVDAKDLEYMSVNDAIQTAIALIRVELQSADDVTPIETEFAANMTVCGIRDTYVQTFTNLLRNAQEATQSIPRDVNVRNVVRIGTKASASPVRKWVEVRITDSGPGIPLEVKDRLFQPYVSSKIGVNRGLGLYVAASFVEALGGEIRVDSPLPGSANGALFTLLFPRVEDERVPPEQFLSGALATARGRHGSP